MAKDETTTTKKERLKMKEDIVKLHYLKSLEQAAVCCVVSCIPHSYLMIAAITLSLDVVLEGY